MTHIIGVKINVWVCRHRCIHYVLFFADGLRFPPKKPLYRWDQLEFLNFVVFGTMRNMEARFKTSRALIGPCYLMDTSYRLHRPLNCLRNLLTKINGWPDIEPHQPVRKLQFRITFWYISVDPVFAQRTMPIKPTRHQIWTSNEQPSKVSNHASVISSSYNLMNYACSRMSRRKISSHPTKETIMDLYYPWAYIAAIKKVVGIYH